MSIGVAIGLSLSGSEPFHLSAGSRAGRGWTAQPRTTALDGSTRADMIPANAHIHPTAPVAATTRPPLSPAKLELRDRSRSPAISAECTLDSRTLEVRDLHVHYHTSQGAVQAVNGVSFEILRGERFG